jgi:hypothetical protein
MLRDDLRAKPLYLHPKLQMGYFKFATPSLPGKLMDCIGHQQEKKGNPPPSPSSSGRNQSQLWGILTRVPVKTKIMFQRAWTNRKGKGTQLLNARPHPAQSIHPQQEYTEGLWPGIGHSKPLSRIFFSDA